MRIVLGISKLIIVLIGLLLKWIDVLFVSVIICYDLKYWLLVYMWINF